MLDTRLPLVVKAKTASGERDIRTGKWYIKRNTPVGEDAEVMEEKPYGGYKHQPYKNILGNRAPNGSIINAPGK